MSDDLINKLRDEVLAASVSGWRKAIYIVTLINEGMTSSDIAAAVNVPGFSIPVVRQHLDAVDLAVEAGVLPQRCDITSDTVLPGDNFDPYYTGIGRDGRYQNMAGRERIQQLAEAAGVGPTKALDIAKNPRALGIAFQGSDRAQRAILDSLEHVPDAVLQQLTIRAYAVMTDREDAGHRIRMAHMREFQQRPPSPAQRIHPDHAVVVNGTVFVFNDEYEAERFQTTYQAVHGRPAMRLSQVIVNRTDAWTSLREFREAQTGESMSTEDWQEYVASLV